MAGFFVKARPARTALLAEVRISAIIMCGQCYCRSSEKDKRQRRDIAHQEQYRECHNVEGQQLRHDASDCCLGNRCRNKQRRSHGRGIDTNGQVDHHHDPELHRIKADGMRSADKDRTQEQDGRRQAYTKPRWNSLSPPSSGTRGKYR